MLSKEGANGQDRKEGVRARVAGTESGGHMAEEVSGRWGWGGPGSV